MNQEHVDLQWSTRGGKLEEGIRIFLRDHGTKHPWQQKFSITMFHARGDREDEDVLTQEALLEMFELYKKWTTLSVTTSRGTTYTTWDLCSRGAMPDLPEPYTTIMPCMTISPLHCFEEEKQSLHPSYQMIDPLLGMPPAQLLGMPPVKALQDVGYLPYTGRPSLQANTTDARKIKAILGKQIQGLPSTGKLGRERGCSGPMKQAALGVDTWSGLVEWSKGVDGMVLSKAGALRFVLFMDGAERVRFRLRFAKPNHTNVQDIEEAMELLSEEWNRQCIKFNKEQAKVLAVSNLEDISFYVSDDMREKGDQVHWGLFGLGGGLMLVFCFLVLAAWCHPLASRAALGSVGLCLVVLSELVAFGFYLLIGRHMNSAIVTVMPLLSLGLGVDDMFVLLRCFSDLGIDFIDGHQPGEIIGEVMARAGFGAALSSTCNFLVFGCGAFLPVPAMSDFCLCAAIVAYVNYFVMVNIFMPVMTAEIKRIKGRYADPHPVTFVVHSLILRQQERKPRTQRRSSIDATSAQDYSGGVEKATMRCLPRYASIMSKPLVQVLAVLLSVGAVVASAVSINNKQIGYAPEDLFEKDDPAGRAFTLYFEKFSMFPSLLCFHDLDVPRHQVEMLQLFKELTELEHAAPSFLPNYLTSFYGSAMQGIQDVPNRSTIAEAEGFGSQWVDPFLAPDGTLTTDPRHFSKKFGAWKALPETLAQAFQNQQFVLADMSFVNEFTYKTHTDASGRELDKIDFSFFSFDYVGLTDQGSFVDRIEETKRIIETSPLRENAFIYSGIFTFWEVFLDLEKQLWTIIALEAGIVFLTSLFYFTGDLLTALITCLSCTMISVEVLGLCLAFLDFNVFVATTTLMACAMSVEYTAHFATAFSLARGPVAERLSMAMAHTFPAITEGTLSTLIGIFPLAFSPMQFTVKYFFLSTAFVVAVGFLNGVVTMPAYVGLLAPLFAPCDRLRRGGAADGAAAGSSRDVEKDLPHMLPGGAAAATGPDAAGAGAMQKGQEGAAAAVVPDATI